jgi:hypothetical protein
MSPAMPCAKLGTLRYLLRLIFLCPTHKTLQREDAEKFFDLMFALKTLLGRKYIVIPRHEESA